MDKELFSIGDVARQSGLNVSALRFYDRVGMLIPVWVDPSSAYRWYSPSQIRTAELIAVLRRVGLALPEISTILTHQGDGKVLREVLDEHVVRLEQGLASAKAKISQIEACWDNPAPGKLDRTLTVAAHELRGALDSVRFAIGEDTDYPALRGVLFEVSGGQLNLAATDRFRAAFCTVKATSESFDFRGVLAGSCVDGLLEVLQEDGEASLTFTAELHVVLGGRVLVCELLDVDFPDLSHLTSSHDGGSRAEVDREWLRRTLGSDPDSARWLVAIDPEGQLRLDPDAETGNEQALLLGAAYLAQAVEAVGGDQLSLEVNGPVAPLAIRRTDHPGSFSVLMPIRRNRP